MTEIIGIRRLDETIHRMGGMGDNWHTTWASNDNLYVSLNDGKGFPNLDGYTGMTHNSRIFILKGYPPNHYFEYIHGFPDLISGPAPEEKSRYYGFGILALEDHLYYYLTTPNHPFAYEGSRFIGCKLVYSPDLGETWLNQDGSPLVWECWSERSKNNMLFYQEPDDAFSLISILQMGKNYGNNADGYVYIYSPNGSVEGTMNQLVLLRVPKDSILDRSAYEFFVARTDDGDATWSFNVQDRGSVHDFPSGYVNVKIHPYAWQPSVVYNAPLDVYMMSSWGMGVGNDGMWFERPSYLGFWVAKQPWGPWLQIHEETSWTPLGDSLARSYQPQMSPKWISGDGKSLWLVFTDIQLLDGDRPYYDYNVQRVEILTD